MASRFLRRLLSRGRHNLHTLRRSPLSELSGSLGDLGTLLPLLTALTLAHSISLPSTLIFTGLSNIVTGLLFGIPLPVQPMKAIASVAIARSYSLEETAAAGIGVAAIIGLLSATGLIGWFARTVPVPVVKGIQVGAGLSLVLSAGGSLLGDLGWTGPSWEDNLLWALFAAFFLLFTTRFQRVPYALVVFVLGLALASIQLRGESSRAALTRNEAPSARYAIPRFPIVVPSWATFWQTFLTASLGQLPLTTLNSIIAVAHLSADLLPSVPTPSVTHIGLSVSAMNLVGCWFGAMPTCHGSGGLAAQYRFGARSGASIIALGIAKLLLGVLAGTGLVDAMRWFPRSLLGIMVVAAGVELARVGESVNDGARDLWEWEDRVLVGAEGTTEVRVKRAREVSPQERQDRYSVMLVTVAGLLAFRNDAVGFVAGMLWHAGLNADKWWAECSSREGAWFSRWGGAGHTREDGRESARLLDESRLEGRLV